MLYLLFRITALCFCNNAMVRRFQKSEYCAIIKETCCNFDLSNRTVKSSSNYRKSAIVVNLWFLLIKKIILNSFSFEAKE